MNKFADDVPVHESIDGGDFEFAGNPAKVLPTVKEGTIITVYGAGDDNITRIEIGVPKKKQPSTILPRGFKPVLPASAPHHASQP